MGQTANLGLHLTATDETDKTFLQYRTELSGIGPDSNMNKIDTAVGDAQENISSLQNSVSSIRTDLTSERANRSSADSLLEARIDELVAPSGEAPSAAEVQDARVGVDATVYPSLGDAIRGQVDDIINQIDSIADGAYINTLVTETNWAQGSYRSDTGEPNNNEIIVRTRIRTNLFDFDTSAGISVTYPEGMRGAIYQYDNDSSNTYIKYSGKFIEGTINMFGNNKKYKVVACYNDDSDIDKTIGNTVEIHCYSTTDTSLSIANKSADAETVGRICLTYKRVLNNGEYLSEIYDNGIFTRNSTSINIPDSPTIERFIMFNMGNPSYNGLKTSLLFTANNDIFFRFKIVGSQWGEFVKLAKKDDLDNSVGYLKNAIQCLYNNQLTLYGNLTKGARSTVGTVISSVGITTLEYFELNVGTKIDVKVSDGWAYTVAEGNSLTKLKYTHRLSKESSFITVGRYVYVTLYKMIDDAAVETSVSDFDNQVVMTIHDLDLSEFTRDYPENPGVANVIKRAYQVIRINYNALATIPNFGSKTIGEGTSFTGIPYSSVRPENLYVPNCVSFHSFMTALKNPNSYIYTRRMNIPGYSGHCYLGSVCSSFVAWCYGIDDTLPTTISFTNYTDTQGNKLFMPLPDEQQNWSNVKLGDMMNWPGKHIVIITDIFRNRFGEITYVEISEETNEGLSRARSTVVYRDEITKMINHGFIICRYSRISDVKYIESPWVHVDISEQANATYNDVIIPRRGDMANWHEGEDVVVDIMKPELFTSYELQDDLSNTTIIGSITEDTLTFSGLSCGTYRLRLTGEENSDWIYFDVLKTKGTRYEILAGRTIKVSPYIDHGVMASVAFCCNNPNRGLDNLAVVDFHVFTDEEKSQGYAIINAPSADNSIAVNDVWFMRCMYKTSFGLYSGQLTEVDVKATGTTSTEGAYERSGYIEDYPLS